MLEDAEKEYQESVVALADAAPAVRNHVLTFRQSQIDEAKWMIETFEGANQREG
ncbi:MAG: hypothetical protein WDM88_13225 [Galbitalea sp.]